MTPKFFYLNLVILNNKENRLDKSMNKEMAEIQQLSELKAE